MIKATWKDNPRRLVIEKYTGDAFIRDLVITPEEWEELLEQSGHDCNAEIEIDYSWMNDLCKGR